jgi:hypothetical protein
MMRGTVLIFYPDADRRAAPTLLPFHRPMTLQEMKDGIGGGYVERIPHFDTIPFNGVIMDCVALCDEDGKRKELSPNSVATALWDHAMHRSAGCGCAPDFLVGKVAVIFGDREFMSEL